MRARTIKPGFFSNDLLAECEPLARLLFAGLWTIADRDGRLEDRPKKIKAEILPYDACEINQLLNQLSAHGFITRYASGQVSYIQINSFTKHQNPHMKEAPSTIPAPIKKVTDPIQQLNEHHTSTVLVPDEHDTNPALSLLPITHSSNVTTEDKSSSVTVRAQQKQIPAPSLAVIQLTDLGDWLQKQNFSPHLNLAEELEKFRDYYTASGGKQSNGNPIKDWPATLRNWLRNANARTNAGKPQGSSPRSEKQRGADAYDAIIEARKNGTYVNPFAAKSQAPP